MKKTILLTMVIVLCFGLSACAKNDKKQAQNKNQGEEVQKGLEVKENNSLLGWLKRGKIVRCQIESPEGEIVMITKNNRVRIEGIPFMSMDSAGEMPQAENGVMLSTEEWTFMWDKKNKKGTKMNNKKMQEITGEETNQQGSWEEMAEAWETQKVGFSCKEISAEDESLEEPSDVVFVDLTEMMSGMSKLGEQLETETKPAEELDMEALESIGEQLREQGLDVGRPENIDNEL